MMDLNISKHLRDEEAAQSAADRLLAVRTAIATEADRESAERRKQANADREFWRIARQERETAIATKTAQDDRQHQARARLAGTSVEAALVDLLDRVAALEAKASA